MPNLIVLLGPTSSGKSELAVELAKYINLNNSTAVIISCDSRQVYKDLDLLSGKVKGQVQSSEFNNSDCLLYKNIEHFLISTVDFGSTYNLCNYITEYIKICNSLKNVEYIILTGGTGLYAKAVYDEYQLKYRSTATNKYSKYSLKELQQLLIQSEFNNSDWNNPIRLINAITRMSSITNQVNYPKFNRIYKFVIDIELKDLSNKIENRNSQRIKDGIINETINLISRFGYDKLLSLGLEARLISYYLLGFVTYNEMLKLWQNETLKYVKRQMTWFNKEKDMLKIKDLQDIIMSLNMKDEN
jgi:tRNA dimethylallyltransferase